MEIGIIGLPQSGKSTLFKIMTGVDSASMFGEKVVKGTAKIPDLRFNELVNIFNPEKISPALVPFVDANASGEKAWDSIKQSLAPCEGILHIIDGFTETNIDSMISKYHELEAELILSDLVTVENRLERLKKLQTKNLKPEESLQLKLLPLAKEQLESGKPLRDLNLSNEDIVALKGFTFWTIRPELIVLNVSDTNLSINQEFSNKISSTSPVISICCQIESEIAELDSKEQKDFLDSLGISEPAFAKIIQTSFKLLGKIFYFTVGSDEVKAWVIPINSTAPRAAAAIHKDFERGFIKAEVISYEEFMNYKDLNAAKSSGKLRLEGKEYIVKDGDIISFRFNV